MRNTCERVVMYFSMFLSVSAFRLISVSNQAGVWKTGLGASLDDGQIHVTFRAVDSFSSIKRAEYSVDAGDWRFVEPLGQLSDSKTEAYDFRISVPTDPEGVRGNTATTAVPNSRSVGAGELEHVVVVRAYDRYDNMSSVKTVIRGK